MRRITPILLVAAIFFSSGCLALRKKFIRKKKSEREPVAYVDYKEYPDAPSPEIYHNYYIFAQGWLEDLYQALTETGNRKKQKQAISEAMMNVEQMISYFNDEGKEQTSPLYQEMLLVQKQLLSPVLNELHQLHLARKVENLKRRIIRELDWRVTSQWVD